MSKNAKIAVIAAFAVLATMMGMLFAKINALEAQNSAGGSPSVPAAAMQKNASQNNESSDSSNVTQNQDDEIVLDISYGESWGEMGEYYTNVTLNLKNTSDKAVSNWEVLLSSAEGTRIEQIWNGEKSQEGNIIHITPVEYNKEIAPLAHLQAAPGMIVVSREKLLFESFSAKAVIDGSDILIKSSENNISPQENNVVSLPAEQDLPISNGSGVSALGQLKVIGTKLCAEDGSVVVLEGMSSHGLAWYPEFSAKYSVKKTKEYGANVYRAAMYTEEYGGYTTGENFRQEAEKILINAVDTAKSLDMYAIIDWHILSDGSPSKHKNEAIDFFDRISQKYANDPAVIYEICNEPNGSDWSSDIKPYANEIIPVIRKNSPNAIVIVGTNTWSQDVDKASEDKLSFDNIMYSFHFYAGTHKLDVFKQKIEKALANGCAVFVTEWGTSAADGNNGVYIKESGEWLKYLSSKQISRINWSLSNKNESSAAVLPSASAENFSYEDLSESGKFVFDSFGNY
uniref:Endoglucanase n=1 Tax=Ruminococcus albus TaxID=1264 RepID=A0A7U3NXG7_RUMAL|nr:cellulase 5A [uncultured bacterium]